VTPLRARVTGVSFDGTLVQIHLGSGATLWQPIAVEDRDRYRRAVVLGHGCDFTLGPVGPERTGPPPQKQRAEEVPVEQTTTTPPPLPDDDLPF